MKNLFLLLCIVLLFSSFAYSEPLQVPFTSLPKVSSDGNIQYVKLVDRQYHNMDNGKILIDYLIFISRNNIKDLVVNDLVINNFVFYINDSGYGREMTIQEVKSIVILVSKDMDNNFILSLKGVPKNVFRVGIFVSIVYKETNLITVMELKDEDSFPDKFLKPDSFFDRKDFSLGRIITVEK